MGWNEDNKATTADTSITLTNTVTDKWMNEQTDGSTTAIYPVWKDIHINYAVMAYGIGVDKDANGKTMGITFGPALGYPEFSPYNGDKADRESKQTFTKSHSVSGDATVMSESVPACTDNSHSVITGIDAGTDEAGNAYRCLHYDNWATIIYWNKVDPHVYDKCIPNHCSKTVVITPNIKTIENGIFSANVSNDYRGLIGDGQSYITGSKLSPYPKSSRYSIADSMGPVRKREPVNDWTGIRRIEYTCGTCGCRFTHEHKRTVCWH